MKAMVLLSGGLDSSTALAIAVDKHGAQNTIALCLSYGQKHEKELSSARAVAAHYGVELIETDVSYIFKYSNSSLLKGSDNEIPKESYAKQIEKTGGKARINMKKNLLILTLCAWTISAMACKMQKPIVILHDNDAHCAIERYPQLRSLYDAMNAAIYEGSGHALRIEAPFVNGTKADIVRKGLELKVPYELTWSCYEGGDTPCGCCGTCIDRAKAFELNGAKDPLIKTD